MLFGTSCITLMFLRCYKTFFVRIVLPTTCMDRLNLILVLFTFGLYGWFSHRYVVLIWISYHKVIIG